MPAQHDGFLGGSTHRQDPPHLDSTMQWLTARSTDREPKNPGHSTQFGYFHEFAKDARGIGARRKNERQRQNGPIERPLQLPQWHTQRPSFPAKSTGFGRLNEGLRGRALFSDDGLFDLTRLTRRPRHTRSEQHTGGTDLKPVGPRLFLLSVFHEKAGAVIHFHGPITDPHAIKVFQPASENLIEEMGLKGIEIPHALGAAHLSPLR